MKELVSIVITCFNMGSYIRECVESVNDQTYRQIEILIVDDGSDDKNTLKILSQLEEEKNIKLIRIENSGVSNARNIGAAASSGTYLMFIDGDDIIAKTYVEESVKCMERDSEIALVYCFCKCFGQKNRIWALELPNYEKILHKNAIFITCLIKTGDFRKSMGFNKNMNMGLEDWDFWIRFLADKKKVCRINKILFYYRIRSDSRNREITSSREKEFKMRVRVLSNNLDAFLKYPAQIKKFKLIPDETVFEKTMRILKKIIIYLQVCFFHRLNQTAFTNRFYMSIIKM